MESASWNGDEDRVKELEEKINKFSNLYKTEQEKLDELYREKEKLRQESGLKVETGSFGAMMQVALVNDGPVTFWLQV